MGLIDRAFDLSGRVAVVTGAAGGIGLATAGLLAEAGAHVVLADRLEDQAREAAGRLRDEGRSCEAAGLDVSSRAQVDALVSDVAARHGRLDVMVNNAGVITESSPLHVTDDELDHVHAVNFRGVVYGSQAAARVMIPQRSGSIVNVTSGAVDVTFPIVSAYSTAKAAAHQYSRALASELAPHQVRVNIIAPGWTDTPMNERHARNPDGTVDPERKAAYVESRAKGIPMGITGVPEDQAFAVLYLASDAARFVTGAVIRVNGGQTMPW